MPPQADSDILMAPSWEATVMSSLGIEEKEEEGRIKYVFTRPITFKDDPNFSERVFILKLLAHNYQIPPQILLGLAYGEGWDRETNEHLAMWHRNGKTIVAQDGSIGLFQIYPRPFEKAAKQVEDVGLENYTIANKPLGEYL